jgi:serine-type D-Ala-D-Ala carboxypeptidase/endopeptidase
MTDPEGTMNANRRRGLLGCWLLLWTVLCPSIGAAQHFPADEDLDVMLRFLVEDRETTGIVVGLRDADGTARVLHYGSAGPGARPLGPKSVFEIGSVTKTFTATLLADMVLRGEVALEDPVSRYLPEHVTVPSRGGREITLLDLATHTSGLPRVPANFRRDNLLDPYAHYTIDLLYAFLSSHELRRDPGEAYEYSNVGYGLLGHALARAAGTGFRELLHQRVLQPLGMTMTGYSLDGDAAEWMVEGHRFGAVVPRWSVTEAMEGAGGLLSTAGDLLRYVAAGLEPPRTELQRAMRLAREIHVPGEREREGQGLGWRTVAPPGRPPIVEHGGASAGFRTRLSLMPERGIGAIVLANEGEFADPLGPDLLRLGPPPAEWPRVRVDPGVLARYAGEYVAVEGHSTFYVRLEDEGYLSFRLGVQVREKLYAASDSTFYLLRRPWSLTFRGGDGPDVEMLIDIDERHPESQGRTRSARRVGPTAPRRRRAPSIRSRRIARHPYSRL